MNRSLTFRVFAATARRVGVACLFAVIVLATNAAFAQQPAARPSLASQYQWAQFGVVGGRIRALSSHFGRSLTTQHEDSSGRREKLTINSANGLAGIRYELTSKTEELSIEISEGVRVAIRRRGLAEKPGPTVAFDQTPEQPLRLTLTEDGQTQTFESPTLWGLMLAEPGISRQRLVPLLELLRPKWALADRLAEIEQGLLRMVRDQQPQHRERWAALVADLGSDRFAVREAAERKLRAAGAAPLAYLQSLNWEQLNAEQRFRVRSILPSPAEAGDDSPQTIVASLVADPAVWVSLLARADEQERALAAQQVQQLLGSKIDFDPAATEELRQGQIQRIKAQLKNYSGDSSRR